MKIENKNVTKQENFRWGSQNLSVMRRGTKKLTSSQTHKSHHTSKYFDDRKMHQLRSRING